MELKLISQPLTHQFAVAFNRTTMELKHALRNTKAFSRSSLLIEPLWNWNFYINDICSAVSFTFNRTTMELKHEKKYESLNAWPAFNRTTMELKRAAVVVITRNTDRLLIEPLWNWNSTSTPCAMPKVPAFNRTTMELKPDCARRVAPTPRTFNRTTMELKRSSCKPFLR